MRAHPDKVLAVLRSETLSVCLSLSLCLFLSVSICLSVYLSSHQPTNHLIICPPAAHFPARRPICNVGLSMLSCLPLGRRIRNGRIPSLGAVCCAVWH
jgi:hypothetical protein